MTGLKVNLMGLPAVNTDMKANLIESATGKIVATRTPFRDGTVNFPNIEAGLYEVQLVHPNFVIPVTETGRPIRVLPNGNTQTSLLIDPKKFQNLAIEDVPDIDLNPMIVAADAIKDATDDLATMQGGDTIRSSHWNTLAGGVSELAGTVSQLAGAVSPRGHNHPEYERKFEEISTNFELLLNTLAASMAEIQRRLQLDRLKTRADDLLLSVVPQTPALVKARQDVAAILDALYEKTTESPVVFGDLLRTGTTDVENIVKAAVGTGGTPRTVKDFRNTVETLNLYTPANLAQELQINHATNRRLTTSAITSLGAFGTGAPISQDRS
jgi:hypothetical protein